MRHKHALYEFFFFTWCRFALMMVGNKYIFVFCNIAVHKQSGQKMFSCDSSFSWLLLYQHLALFSSVYLYAQCVLESFSGKKPSIGLRFLGTDKDSFCTFFPKPLRFFSAWTEMFFEGIYTIIHFGSEEVFLLVLSKWTLGVGMSLLSSPKHYVQLWVCLHRTSELLLQLI